MERSRAPLYEKLCEHWLRGPSSFHVPGHKYGKGVLEPHGRSFLQEACLLDATEVADLDDLHAPEGVIAEAEALAADCFGAEQSFFLVGGSTAGNMALILTMCGQGDVILVQRTAHKSVLHGLMLAGAKAVMLPPAFDRYGEAGGIAEDMLERALAAYPEAKAVMITSPSYYGRSGPVRRLAEIAHRHGKPLLVDEAHGAHFGFHPKLPASALSQGADAVVQSTHKMLSGMTMSAMLHVQGGRIPRDVLKQRLTMLQSSSPSYVLLASLDLARRQMHTQGYAVIEQAMEAADCFRQGMESLPQFRLSSADDPMADPLKITVTIPGENLSGFELSQLLQEENCYPELADLRRVLLVFGPGSTIEDSRKLYAAFQRIGMRIPHEQKNRVKPPAEEEQHELLFPESPLLPIPFTMNTPESRWVPLEQAPGMYSAQLVVPYPPGIPLLFAGERVTAAAIDYIRKLNGFQAKIHGIPYEKTGWIKVFAE
ncbi:aminotransferase class I/II-fold pyridoxal phosphate-dependent enzyme [Paenibacillus turpanensis]|uniref:aminotransferase class I/II-fold pyridoxal phosphate-dependent enzyme n=1 Tax=Paenibacillus turpanensis TaxID=2689078 RepID=UPI00140AE1C0